MLGWFGLSDEAAPGEADRLLADLAQAMAREGLRVAGAVQQNTDLGADCACDMDLVILGEEDQPIRISQSLGNGSTGCRLDAGALEIAAARVSARLDGADILILPKFGRQEAVGRGFISTITDAMSRDLPLLLHVPRQQRDAFAEFCGDLGQYLEPGELAHWCRMRATP